MRAFLCRRAKRSVRFPSNNVGANKSENTLEPLEEGYKRSGEVVEEKEEEEEEDEKKKKEKEEEVKEKEEYEEQEEKEKKK